MATCSPFSNCSDLSSCISGFAQLLILLMMNSHFVLLDLPGTGVEVEVVDHGNGSKLLYWRGSIICLSSPMISRVTSSVLHAMAVEYLNGQFDVAHLIDTLSIRNPLYDLSVDTVRISRAYAEKELFCFGVYSWYLRNRSELVRHVGAARAVLAHSR